MKPLHSGPLSGDGGTPSTGDRLRNPVENRVVFGGAVGVISGFVAIPAMILFIFLYSVCSTRQLGSTTGLAMIVPAAIAIVFGGIVAAVAGRLCRVLGIRVSGARRGACFGACVMAVVGFFVILVDYATNPAFFAEWAVFCVGLELISPVAAGIVVGAFLGRITC